MMSNDVATGIATFLTRLTVTAPEVNVTVAVTGTAVVLAIKQPIIVHCTPVVVGLYTVVLAVTFAVSVF